MKQRRDAPPPRWGCLEFSTDLELTDELQAMSVCGGRDCLVLLVWSCGSGPTGLVLLVWSCVSGPAGLVLWVWSTDPGLCGGRGLVWMVLALLEEPE